MAATAKKTGWFIALAIALLFMLAALPILIRLGKPPLPTESPFVSIIDPPQHIAELNLVDFNGDTFTHAQLAGAWTLVFTGFLFCPDICPTTLLDMAAVFRKMEDSEDGLAGMRLLFISVDPFRDTPELLKEYVAYFHPEFLGATGTPAELKNMSENLQLFYVYSDPETGEFFPDVLKRPPPEYYNVVHSTAILVINPQSEIVARLSPPFQTDRVISLLTAIRDHYRD